MAHVFGYQILVVHYNRWLTGTVTTTSIRVFPLAARTLSRHSLIDSRQHSVWLKAQTRHSLIYSKSRQHSVWLEAQTRHSLIFSVSRQHSDSKLRLDTCLSTRDNTLTRSSDSTTAHRLETTL
eukprot:2978594-Rhodomonas_salina.1